MGLFKKKKKNKDHSSESAIPRGFYEVKIAGLKKLTDDSVLVTLDIPSTLASDFQFIPGQYLDFAIEAEGKQHRRSYSICSGKKEALSVAVKSMEHGTVSKWFNTEAEVGETLFVSKPNGQFTLEPTHKTVVAFAAGSGITPVLSMAKELTSRGDTMHLFYGNKTPDSTLFSEELNELANVHVKNIYSSHNSADALSGRLDDENTSTLIKENLDLLKADAFFLCGPIGMIETVQKKLELFGVSPNKIKKELFSAPVEAESELEVSDSAVKSAVKVQLDGEWIDVDYQPKGKSILELLDAEGYDPPYSCRGGVCSTCKARIIEGSARMKINYVLTDAEIAEGYLLCCQAEPTTEKLSITFDA